MLFKPETGETLANMIGGLIKEMCATGATRPFVAPDAKIPGAGVQAKSHVEAMRCVRDFDKVCVWVRDPEKEKGFANEHGAVAMDAEDAVHGGNGDQITGPSAPGRMAERRCSHQRLWRAHRQLARTR